MTLIQRKPALTRGLLRSGNRIYLLPRDIVTGEAARAGIAFGTARPLAGGASAYHALDLIVRTDDGIQVVRTSLAALDSLDLPDIETRLERLGAKRALIDDAGLPMLMGIVNATPDSFSDGGQHADAESAIAHGLRLSQEGATILDIGGESTRPGADPVSIGEEIRRTEPVVRALAGAGHSVSIDSRNAPVMAAALDAGAAWVNDVSGLTHDSAASALVAERGCPVVLMHMRADPKTMQLEPSYQCAPLDVYDELEERVAAAVAAGIARDRIVIDPGFGFAKSTTHNLEVTSWLALFHGLGCPVLFGASRKSSIGQMSRGEPVGERLPGSLALGLAAAARGAQILRVHDVGETMQALAVQRALDAVDQ
ncbi:MAG: dihydropteroate synthase [Thalassobaculum sp.]|uniref:dihydropteroate synthase n=1 Tax=Thalassobaculum sp. TaxID=2022740 RepID=UPI0032F06C3B